MAKVLIGTGKTDNNGIAKLDKDSNNQTLTHSYTGTGAGYVEVIAVCDGLESAPFTILDCAFLDNGTDTPSSSKWTIASNLTAGTDTDGYASFSKVASSATNGKAYANVDMTGDWEAIFDLKADGVIRVGVRNSNNNRCEANITAEEWTTIRVKVQNNTLTFASQNSDETWTNITYSTNNADLTSAVNLQFYLYNTTAYLTMSYRNLKIYPI